MNLHLGRVNELLGSHVVNVYFRGNEHNRAVLFMKLMDVERALAAGLLVDKGPVGEAGVPGTEKGK